MINDIGLFSFRVTVSPERVPTRHRAPLPWPAHAFPRRLRRPHRRERQPALRRRWTAFAGHRRTGCHHRPAFPATRLPCRRRDIDIIVINGDEKHWRRDLRAQSQRRILHVSKPRRVSSRTNALPRSATLAPRAATSWNFDTIARNTPACFSSTSLPRRVFP